MRFKTLTELFTDPKRWTKRTIARDADAEPVAADHADARCWCLEGGLTVVYGHLGYVELQTIVARLRTVLQNKGLSGSIYTFNDYPSTTHAQVLEVVMEAGV